MEVRRRRDEVTEGGPDGEDTKKTIQKRKAIQLTRFVLIGGIILSLLLVLMFYQNNNSKLKDQIEGNFISNSILTSKEITNSILFVESYFNNVTPSFNR
jgi:pheromone shutdown protein TraB